MKHEKYLYSMSKVHTVTSGSLINISERTKTPKWKNFNEAVIGQLSNILCIHWLLNIQVSFALYWYGPSTMPDVLKTVITKKMSEYNFC